MMSKTDKLSLQEGQEEKQFSFKNSKQLFKKELQPFIQGKTEIERCFLLSLSDRVVPNHFPFVFWKAPFVFHAPSWQTAEERMPELYRSIISSANALPCKAEDNVLNALMNYAVWRGRFSWLYSLAALYCQKNTYNAKLFQITSLYLAYKKKIRLAQFYNSQIKRPSPYYALCFQNLAGLGVQNIWGPSHPDKSFLLVKSLAKGGGSKQSMQDILNEVSRLPIGEEELLHQYEILLAKGLLFRAARLILRYERQSTNLKSCLVNIVLQLYIQNQKYYAYLLRIINSTVWPGERAWYEAEYCIARLNLSREKKLIWIRIRNKKQNEMSFPKDADRKSFHYFMHQALPDQPALPQDIPQHYADIVLNHFIATPVSQANVLRRRYALYCSLVQNPLAHGLELDIYKIGLYSTSLIWTLYQYRENLYRSPFMEAAAALAGQNLALRAFVGICRFQNGFRTLSGKFLHTLNMTHPLVQTLQISFSLESGETEAAEKISNRLLRYYPQDPVLRLNHILLLERKTLSQ